MQEVLKIGIDQVQHAIVDSATGYSHWTHKRLEEMEETCSHGVLCQDQAIPGVTHFSDST